MTTAPLLTGYFIALAGLAAAGVAYTLLYWMHTRGLRGLAMAVALACVAVLASCFAALHGVPWDGTAARWLLVLERSAWGPLVLSLLVLVDLYAADSNSHRAISTMIYLRWERLRSRRG